jgi:hypothetical protein
VKSCHLHLVRCGPAFSDLVEMCSESDKSFSEIDTCAPRPSLRADCVLPGMFRGAILGESLLWDWAVFTPSGPIAARMRSALYGVSGQLIMRKRPVVGLAA